MFIVTHTGILGGKAVQVDPGGPLNGETASRLDDYMSKLLDGGTTRFVVNLEKVESVSSAGIGVTLYLHRKVERAGGTVVYFSPNEEIMSLYQLLGLQNALVLRHSRIEAMEMIDEGSGAAVDYDHAESSAGEPISGHGQEPEAVVVECHTCNSLVRARQSGDYLCPGCGARFTLHDDHQVTWHQDTDRVDSPM